MSVKTEHGPMSITENGSIGNPPADGLYVYFSSQPKGILEIKNLTTEASKKVVLSNSTSGTKVWETSDDPTGAAGNSYEISFNGRCASLQVASASAVRQPPLAGNNVEFDGAGSATVSALSSSGD